MAMEDIWHRQKHEMSREELYKRVEELTDKYEKLKDHHDSYIRRAQAEARVTGRA